MTTIRGTGAPGNTPSVPTTTSTRTTANATSASTASGSAGYAQESSFEAVKSVADQYKQAIADSKAPSGFSDTRFQTLKAEANSKIAEMLSRQPPPTPEQAAKELDLVMNKMENQAMIEDSMFKSLWNDLVKSYEQSLQELRRIQEGG